MTHVTCFSSADETRLDRVYSFSVAEGWWGTSPSFWLEAASAVACTASPTRDRVRGTWVCSRAGWVETAETGRSDTCPRVGRRWKGVGNVAVWASCLRTDCCLRICRTSSEGQCHYPLSCLLVAGVLNKKKYNYIYKLSYSLITYVAGVKKILKCSLFLRTSTPKFLLVLLPNNNGHSSKYNFAQYIFTWPSDMGGKYVLIAILLSKTPGQVIFYPLLEIYLWIPKCGLGIRKTVHIRCLYSIKIWFKEINGLEFIFKIERYYINN